MRIAIRVNDPELLDRVDALVPPGAQRDRAPVVDRLYSIYRAPAPTRPGLRTFHLAYADAARLTRSLDLEDAFEQVDGDLRLFVAARARRRVFVHAGAVAWKGRAALIPGRTFTGKSTLVEALVRAGATYYSDEYAVLDARGRLHPYARPLSLRVAGHAHGVRRPVEAIGGHAGDEPLDVGLVVVTHFKEGARFRPRGLTPGQAMLALFDNTVPARHAAARSLEALRHAVAGARAIRGVRGEAAEAAGVILRRLEAG